MTPYIPDPAERSELAFEAGLSSMVKEIRGKAPCSYREAEEIALKQMAREDEEL